MKKVKIGLYIFGAASAVGGLVGIMIGLMRMIVEYIQEGEVYFSDERDIRAMIVIGLFFGVAALSGLLGRVLGSESEP